MPPVDHAPSLATVSGMNLSQGQRVKAVKEIQRSSGAAWPGDTGSITKVTGDGYVIRWSNGAETSVVKDNEVERA
jgi:hypothetical protein